MKTLPRVLLVLAVLFVLAAQPGATAAEWFVSKHGNDTATGSSEAAPFATIGKGMTALKPGDTLTILPGEYFEAVQTTASGTAEAPITIRAKIPGSVLMRGDVQLAGFLPVAGVRHVYVAEFRQRVEGVAERSTLRMLTPMLSLAEVEMTLGSYWHDEKAGRLHVHSSDSQTPDAHALCVSVTNDCGLSFIGQSAGRHVTIDGLAFTGYNHRDYSTRNGSRTRWGLMFRNPEHVTVRRCTAFLNSGGIHFLGGGQGCVVEDCHAFANWSRYVDIGNNINGWGVTGATFRRNRVEGFMMDKSTSRGDIVFYSGGDGCVMEENLCVNAGLMIKGGHKDAIQRGNVTIGRKFYRAPDATNLQLESLRVKGLAETYADPLNGDFRLQSGAKADAVPLPCRDDVFYVSPQGDDAAPGTSIRQPWRTLAHAAKRATAGHTVYLLPGTYEESLVPANSGTAEKPLRFLRHGHGCVVLDGGNARDVGIDLSMREHVRVRGLLVRSFKRNGLLVKQGRAIRVEQCTFTDLGADAAAFSGVQDLSFTNNLARHCAGAGLRLHESAAVTVTGNVFDDTAGPRVACDRTSLSGLWSERNAFAPVGAQTPLLLAADIPFPTLAAWQERSRLDAHSVSCPSAVASSIEDVFTLDTGSPLAGTGSLGTPIGPFLRLTERAPLPVEDITVRSVTHSTANLEWWLRSDNAETTLEWGDTPDCPNKVELPSAAYHSASLAGLKAGTDYHFRISTRANGDWLRFATSAPEASKARRPAPTPVQRLTTTRAPLPARILHVAATGDDARDGLTSATAWRTLTHAAALAHAGDTVEVHAGVYEEFIPVRATGDADAPLTFRAAPGEVVWLSGTARNRGCAFHIAGKNHVVIDGFRFREFGNLGSQVVRIEGGRGHIVRRCFYDGRVPSGYSGVFLGAEATHDFLVENCVMIGGMGEGMTLSRCEDATIRHCVFYNNNIRAMTVNQWNPKARFTLTHNLICDNIPTKTGNSLIRLMDVENLVSGHNLWFTRTDVTSRKLVEAMMVGGKDVWVAKPGSRQGQDLTRADLLRLTGQEKTSTFGNPAFPVLAALDPAGKEGHDHRTWLRREMRLLEADQFAPLDFADFVPSVSNPLARAADGRPVGLDPDAFR
ncbi:MAG: right-handed parallel beta-helix repeat-containing protein [Prosthecobacter sp.]